MTMELRQPERERFLAAFDNERANAEGWALFNDGELQRLDHGRIASDGTQSGEPVFANDTEAYGWVCAMAASGSNYHKMALRCVSPKWVETLTFQ